MHFEAITLNDLTDLRTFQSEGWPDIIPDFEFYVSSEFCYPLKAMIDTKIVGIGTLITFENTSWLAHINKNDRLPILNLDRNISGENRERLNVY